MTHTIDVSALLGDAQRLFQTLVVVREELPLSPSKEHLVACINYSDLLEMRAEFVGELVHTVVPFVYSADKQNDIIAQMGDAPAQAWSRLTKRARQKFRRSDVTGQFSELLLFNVLRHHFGAAPLIRKMPITTNPEIERQGADAIHVAAGDAGYVIYLGEAKTYNRDSYGLRAALKDAVDDVVERHYSEHRRELDLYRFEDFLPEPLQDLADRYISGRLQDTLVQIVCLASYDHHCDVTGASREECVDNALNVIRADVAAIRAAKLVEGVPENLLPRFNYVCFGVAEMNALLRAFGGELGV